MKTRQTKEKYMTECKSIGDKIQAIKDSIGYYPTYREIAKRLKSTGQSVYGRVQEAIKNGWMSDDLLKHYERRIK